MPYNTITEKKRSSIMKKFFSVLLSALIILSVTVCAVYAAPAIDDNCVFVAVDGDDAADGSISHPLATISAAKKKAKSLSGNVTVYFREGIYTFDSTVNFTSEDKENVTYKAYNGEKVVFTAGTPYTGFEECTVNGVAAFKKNIGTDAVD